MNTILYLKKDKGLKKVLGFILIGKGLYGFLFGTIIFALILLLIGLYFLLDEGAELNLENKTYRIVKSLFGLHFGSWKACPEFEYVSVFRTKEPASSAKNNSIHVNLFYSGNKHFTFFHTVTKADAFAVAERIKAVFKIDVLDATESEKVWL